MPTQRASARVEACLAQEEARWVLPKRKYWRAVLRSLLARQLSCAPCEVPILYGEYGKPFLGATHAKPIRFSVAHSGACALIGLSDSHEIGVDVEEMRAMVDEKSVMERVLSDRELAYVEGLSGSEKWSAFFQLWTHKESVFKALGTGVDHPMRQADVLDGELFGCRFTSIAPERGYKASVAWVNRISTPAPEMHILRSEDPIEYDTFGARHPTWCQAPDRVI